jgi:hypothetical protein
MNSLAHAKRCYVKLTLVAAVAALSPSVARAEVVPGANGSPVLAVSSAGMPSVAYLDDRGLVVSTRRASGWRASRVRLPVPAKEAVVVSAAVARDGLPVVLVEDFVRRAVVVAWRRPQGWLVRRPARLSRGTQLGVGGLALERRGTPVVAYAFRRSSGKTSLRLTRIDARGRVTTKEITKLGFPNSTTPPSATPHVTPSGVVRVVEAYTSAVIDWYPEGRTWTGQFLFQSKLGSPLGRVLALAGPRTAVIAWTQDYPTFAASWVYVQEGEPDGDPPRLLEHARLSALTLADGRPEIAANDWVELDGWTTLAGMLAAPGADPVELDGRVDGYAAVGATRQLLLSTDRGVEWFSTPPPAVRVSLVVEPAGTATGRVDGAVAGEVQIYREAPGTGRQLVATVPIAADGSFTAAVPASPTLYRAVYRDPTTGVPYGSLTRPPTGA